jgi:hypothetical protein
MTHRGRVALLFVLGTLARTAAPVSALETLEPAKAKALARDLYFYALPIVLMDTTMRQATNVPNATAVPMRAPINQFAHFRTYPKADSRDVVRFNFDTLYSFAWADLAKEPIVLSVPDTGGRFYLVPSLDMWTDVFSSVGSRTTGTKAGRFAFVAPGWAGDLPDGVERIQAPTSMIWIMGRTQTNGPADYDAVHKVQDGYALTPLSQLGTNYAPPAESPVDPAIDGKTPPLITVSKLDGMTMLARLAELMKKYPPHLNDYPILLRARAFGIEPGKDFDPSKLDPATIAAINEAAKEALPALEKRVRSMGSHVNGWNLTTDGIGTYGTSYEQRAVVALAGLGANLPEDAIYPTAFVSGDGQPLNSSKKYLVHFDKGKLPPADAFWSITMYDDQGFQVPNPIDRFAIGDRDKLAFNPDGSLDLYVQTDSPGKDKEANWLPAPNAAPFALTMRIYAPRPEAMDGSWTPPPVTVRE